MVGRGRGHSNPELAADTEHGTELRLTVKDDPDTEKLLGTVGRVTEAEALVSTHEDQIMVAAAFTELDGVSCIIKSAAGIV